MCRQIGKDSQPKSVGLVGLRVVCNDSRSVGGENTFSEFQLCGGEMVRGGGKGVRRRGARVRAEGRGRGQGLEAGQGRTRESKAEQQSETGQ